MARLNQTYYANELPRSADIAIEPVPAGIYEVQVTGTDLKTTQKGDGQYIWLEHTVVRNAEYNGRKIFSRITISNPSQKAVDIGRAQLGDILEITGLTNGFNDTEALMNKLLGIKVKVVDGTPERPNKQNEVTAYLYPDGHQPGRGPAPQGQPAVHAAAPADAPKSAPKRPF